jgi:secreted trypsin-like serine protease
VSADGISVFADQMFLANYPDLREGVRVIGGEPTDCYPDCVAVGRADSWCCSGTLIGPRAVVTAGHCVAQGCCERIFIGPDVHQSSSGRIYTVESAIVHPDYRPPTPYDDFAILILAETVSDVAPRGIAAADTIASACFFRLVGYGATSPYGDVGKGRRRMVDVARASPNPRFGLRPATEFVCGRPDLERDTCPGDSGGPAYAEVGGQWLLAGATSRATTNHNRDNDHACGDGGIYTNVVAYLDWIDGSIGYDSSRYTH